MLVRDVIGFLLSDIEIPLFIIAMFVTIAKLRRAAERHEIVTFAYTFWGEVLFYCVGLGLAYAWYFHAFLSSFTAPLIGWPPSPFEWELAWAQLGVAVIALASLWRGYEFRAAATLMFALFSFGAASQHIHFIVAQHDYAPGNAGLVLWFGELALPLLLLVLAMASRDSYERTVGRSRV